MLFMEGNRAQKVTPVNSKFEYAIVLECECESKYECV